MKQFLLAVLLLIGSSVTAFTGNFLFSLYPFPWKVTIEVLTRQFFPVSFANYEIHLVSPVAQSNTKVTTTSLYDRQPVERGVSIDQDGKSNVWAIEPKMELDIKSSEEKNSAALLAGGAVAVFSVLAGAVLTQLPH